MFSWVWGVGTLEPVDVCVCQMSFWTKLPWTNFGQLFGDLDKFGQPFWGLSNDFGCVFQKHYIIEETRFWNGVGKFVNFAQGVFSGDRYVLFFRYTYDTIVVRIDYERTNVMLRDPLFSKVDFQNLHANSKKPAMAFVVIDHTSRKSIYVNNKSQAVRVDGFIHPQTGYIVTGISRFGGMFMDDMLDNPYHQLQNLAHAYMCDACEKKLDELNQLYQSDAAKYEERGYKPIEQLETELERWADNRTQFLADLNNQLKYLKTPPLPIYNHFLRYANDKDGQGFVTEPLTYNNPAGEVVTPEQQALVDKFMGVFLEPADYTAVAWYLGAALCNKTINDPSVSKFLVVTSAEGGYGKSTLMMALFEGLFDQYMKIYSVFDNFFLEGQKFSLGNLPTSRITLHLEADFGLPHKQGRYKGEKRHDFNGMNVAALKAVMGDGYLDDEEKFGAMESTTRYGLHVVLTNNPPRLENDSTTPMARRILPVIMKTTLMREKGQQLGMATDVEIKQFVKDNAQAFANVFVHTYLENPMRYAAVNYDTQAFYNVQKESKDERKAHQESVRQEIQSVGKEHGVYEVLRLAGDRLGLRVDAFINALQNPDGTNVCIIEDKMYVNRSRNFIGTLVDDVAAIQTLLKDVYGDATKKNGMRMYAIPLVSDTDADEDEEE